MDDTTETITAYPCPNCGFICLMQPAEYLCQDLGEDGLTHIAVFYCPVCGHRITKTDAELGNVYVKGMDIDGLDSGMSDADRERDLDQD